MPNALVIGLGGVGSVVAHRLHEYDCFDQVVLADIDPTFAEKLHIDTKRSRFKILTLNAMETPKVAAAITEHKVSVTLNCCNCYTNYSILEACMRAGSHYIDMAADIYSAPGVKKAGKR
jgi:saccharopine dehydrogenase (NAD+, L-lysine-forming)